MDSMRAKSIWPVIMAARKAKDWLGPEHICLQQDLNYLCVEKVLPQEAGQTVEKWYSFMLVSFVSRMSICTVHLISAAAALQAGHADIQS